MIDRFLDHVRRSPRIVVGGAGISGLATLCGAAGDALADPPPDSIRLMGTIRDFRSTHADFNVVAAAGNGHYADNVLTWLDAELLPEPGRADTDRRSA